MSKEVKKMKKKKAQNKKETFPSKFPFWARLKISKNRTQSSDTRLVYY